MREIDEHWTLVEIAEAHEYLDVKAEMEYEMMNKK